jgi:hypothetical protein
VKTRGRPSKFGASLDLALEKVDQRYPALLRYEQRKKDRLLKSGKAVLKGGSPSLLAYARLLRHMKDEFGPMTREALSNKHSAWRNGNFHSAENHVDFEGYDAEIERLFPAALGRRESITGQLVDTASGAHIWADRFDGTMEDIFDLQDRMSTIILGVIAPKLEFAEIERAKRKPTGSLDAYDYYCAEWRAFTREVAKPLPRHLSFSKRRSNSIQALHQLMRWPRGAITFLSHFGRHPRRCARLSDWRGWRHDWVRTMRRPFRSRGLWLRALPTTSMLALRWSIERCC